MAAVMDAAGELEEAARNIGVIPGDPAYPLIQALCHYSAELKKRDVDLMAELKTEMKLAASVAGRSTARHLATHLDRVSVCFVVVLVVSAAVAGGLLDHFVLAPRTPVYVCTQLGAVAGHCAAGGWVTPP